MMIIRPLMETDADALLNLARKAGIGFTSLPARLHLPWPPSVVRQTLSMNKAICLC